MPGDRPCTASSTEPRTCASRAEGVHGVAAPNPPPQTLPPPRHPADLVLEAHEAGGGLGLMRPQDLVACLVVWACVAAPARLVAGPAHLQNNAVGTAGHGAGHCDGGGGRLAPVPSIALHTNRRFMRRTRGYAQSGGMAEGEGRRSVMEVTTST